MGRQGEASVLPESPQTFLPIPTKRLEEESQGVGEEEGRGPKEEPETRVAPKAEGGLGHPPHCCFQICPEQVPPRSVPDPQPCRG